MSSLGIIHQKDKFGNDIWFGHPDIKFPAMKCIHDFNEQAKFVKNLPLRSDDVITVCYPKSGQNWTNHMVTMLMEGTIQLQPVETNDRYIWLDVVGGARQLAPPDRPRTLWSHLRYRDLPRDVANKGVKLVYVRRNPKDVFVSSYAFVQNFGGKMEYKGTWEQFFSVMLEQGFWYGDIFEYLRDWESEIERHPDHPILQVTYEDLKQDTAGQLERLNEFLGTQRSREFCQEVAHTCRFSNMGATRVVSSDNDGTSEWKGTSRNSFYRKGEVGDWKNWFTVAQNEEFEAVFSRKMAGSKLKFRFE